MQPSNAIQIETSDLFVTAPDGLKLHVRSWGPRLAPSIPVVCLPGLTRTVADFEDIAIVLAGSERSAAPGAGAGFARPRPCPTTTAILMNYTLVTELADLRAVLTALDVQPAVFIGTSRGGLLTMMLAVAQPTAIAGAVLNDIGPVIEPKGLARIKSYVGKMPQPKSFEEAADIFRRMFGPQFTRFSDADWIAYARRSFKIEHQVMVPTYDVRIAKTMENIDFDQPLPPMWGAFDALGRVPLMLLRGENSDLLSEATAAAMRTRQPSMDLMVVPNQGHAPVLSGTEMLGRLAAFVANCERARPA